MEWALGGLGPVTVEGAVLRGPSGHGMGALTVMLPFPRVCLCVSVCFLRHHSCLLASLTCVVAITIAASASHLHAANFQWRGVPIPAPAPWPLSVSQPPLSLSLALFLSPRSLLIAPSGFFSFAGGQDICGLRWRRLRLHEARLPQGESADSCQALGYGIFGERGGCCGCVSEGLPCCRVLPDGSGGEFLADS
ncbi:hypothetical protein KC19_9G015700 [Ceratodon purpureus]|uniref:Uncharacterized protein n=1 Tax=Ceratodon purpureus TaxID=3225 RepID=A0A8T0GPG8_CERPU|nr:hypothetical protein KC19_9G015700 [Ceratodon purpureus]